MRGAVLTRPRSDALSVATRVNFRPSFSSTASKKFLEAPGVEQIFEPRLGAVGAVAVFDEDAQDRVRDLDRFIRTNDNSRVAREILVARDAAQRETEPHARRDAMAVAHLDRLKADVVRVLQRADHVRRRRRRC